MRFYGATLIEKIDPWPDAPPLTVVPLHIALTSRKRLALGLAIIGKRFR